jgi:DNA polymerase III delta subunit
MYVAHGFGRSRDDLSRLAAQTRIGPYFIPQLVRAANTYSLAEITHALDILRLCDYALKSQSISELLTLRLSLIAIVRQMPVRHLPFAGSS